ncbi:hypothetical protein [Limisalsivibrio acetivorans]|uniref:hypothetical protein n=1 Tax=Limisalsivibrio acetivorans TaxID=1304888 RepID=UPI0003B5BC62|nr:hypothetical protein [Limisalsivibrio acetivorans]
MIGATGIFIIALTAFILNLPFGYLRRFTKKFGIAWFLCIHIPIAIVAFVRITTETPWSYIPLFLAVGIAGQIAGHRLPFGKQA